jgi:membrane protease YdiL (CAAX protease family)
MLGYVAGAFAWGAIKAVSTHARKHDVAAGWDFGVGELTEELVFRVGLERGLGLVGLGAAPARLLQAGVFGAMHPGNEVDAALGGLVYGAAYDRYGLLGSTLTHLMHNLGVYVGAR